VPPLPIGALLRFAIDDVRARIYAGVAAAARPLAMAEESRYAG
jgi:hypothetical protein